MSIRCTGVVFACLSILALTACSDAPMATDGPMLAVAEGSLECATAVNNDTWSVTQGHFDAGQLLAPEYCWDLPNGATVWVEFSYTSGDTTHPADSLEWRLRPLGYDTLESPDTLLDTPPGIALPHTEDTSGVDVTIPSGSEGVHVYLLRRGDETPGDEWELWVELHTKLSAPTNLSATPTASTSIALSWQNTEGPHSQVRTHLYRAEGLGSYVHLDEVVSSTEAYVDTGLEPETEYRYQVRHQNQNRLSDFSAPDTAVTPPTPPPLSITISGPSVIATPGTQTWTANPSGGAPPYAFQWLYKPEGGQFQVLPGETAITYTRDVGYDDVNFGLKVVVTPTEGSAKSANVSVTLGWEN